MFISQRIVVEDSNSEQDCFTLVYDRLGHLITIYKEHQPVGYLEQHFGDPVIELNMYPRITKSYFDRLLDHLGTPHTI